MYNIKLINPLRQFGTVCWTLIFSDSTDRLPSLRIDKKYSELWSEQEICNDIAQTISNQIFELTRPLSTYDDEGNVILQEPGYIVDLNKQVILVDDIGGVQYQWQL